MRLSSMAFVVMMFNMCYGCDEDLFDGRMIRTRGHQCADGSFEEDRCHCEEMKTLCKRQPCLLTGEVMRGHLCDGVFDCSDLSDECLCDRRTKENARAYDMCQEIFHGIEQGEGCVKGQISCDLSSSRNQSTCVPIDQVCDKEKDCADGLDEMLCRYSCGFQERSTETKYRTYFSCESHETKDLPYDSLTPTTGYVNKSWKFIDWRRQFDDIADCSDYTDEWHDNLVYCAENDSTNLVITRCQGRYGKRLFASPVNAIDGLLFPCVEWFFGVFGLIGNTIVAINSIAAIRKRRERHRPSVTENDTNASVTSIPGAVNSGKVINHILVLFLCTSDLLMSIQIILMASANAMFKGNFWEVDDIWQTSAICSMTGSLAVFSTQASAFMIVVISYVRLYAVTRPFNHLRVRCVLLACFVTYAIAALLMAIPLFSFITPLDQYFTTAVKLQNAPQTDANVLERDKLEEYVQKIMYLSARSYQTIDFKTYSWSDLEALVVSVNPKFGGWSYFGYHSQISVCIPPIVSHWTDPGLLYSFCLLVIDFSAFLLVFIAYYVVFRTTRRGKDSCIMAVGCCAKHRPHPRQDVEVSSNEEIPTRQRLRSMTRDEEDYEMQKRILWIIGTDCICWAPICLLTLACMINQETKSRTTLLLAMFAVQINCVVNPLVYSRRVRFAIKRGVGKCCSKIAKVATYICKRRSGSQDDETPEENLPESPFSIHLDNVEIQVADKSTSTESVVDTIYESDSLSNREVSS